MGGVIPKLIYRYSNPLILSMCHSIHFHIFSFYQCRTTRLSYFNIPHHLWATNKAQYVHTTLTNGDDRYSSNGDGRNSRLSNPLRYYIDSDKLSMKNKRVLERGQGIPLTRIHIMKFISVQDTSYNDIYTSCANYQTATKNNITVKCLINSSELANYPELAHLAD